MAMIPTSVVALTEPLPDASDLDARVDALRRLFPRAFTLGEDVSIWYGAVLRGDVAKITVGARTNIQDGAVVHTADDLPVDLGEDVVVGHRAMLHACRVEDGC